MSNQNTPQRPSPARVSPQKAKEGAPLADAGKQYSESSEAALKRLESLDGHFVTMAQRVANIDSSIDMNNTESLARAKDDLAQIIGDLEKLQFNGTDAVGTSDLHSGRDDAREHRKALNREIEELLRQTQMLYAQLERTLRMKHNQEGNHGSADDDEEPELSREEIAKLLLLISRAYSIQHISTTQRRKIKDDVCQRKGYLRKLVREQDIGKVLQNLAELYKD